MDFTPLPGGRSVRGREIPAWICPGRPWLYLLAGVHGDEIEGIHVLARLFEHLKIRPPLPYGVLVLPALNPDGHAAQSRLNADGVDLNRNLPSAGWSETARAPAYNPGKAPLSEPENVFLDGLFRRYPPGLIISFHSWKPLINYNGDCREVAQLLALHNGYPSCAEIEGHPTPGSLGEYGPQYYHCPVLTLEFPLLKDGHSLEQIWRDNAAGLEALLESGPLARAMGEKKSVLFLCGTNSCRSQMAEGLGRHFRGKDYNFYSAGSRQGTLDPKARKVMEELGVDISFQRSKSVAELPPEVSMDMVITLCDQDCPYFPGGTTIRAVFDDPPKTSKGELSVYRRVRDEIKAFLEEHL